MYVAASCIYWQRINYIFQRWRLSKPQEREDIESRCIYLFNYFHEVRWKPTRVLNVEIGLDQGARDGCVSRRGIKPARVESKASWDLPGEGSHSITIPAFVPDKGSDRKPVSCLNAPCFYPFRTKLSRERGTRRSETRAGTRGPFPRVCATETWARSRSRRFNFPQKPARHSGLLFSILGHA